MSKPVVRLFRDPVLAGRAVQGLLAQGFVPGEIGVLGRPQESQEVCQLVGPPSSVEMAGLGVLNATGPLSHDPRKALAMPADTWGYYEMGLKLGGVLVSVHPEGKDGSRARQVLRQAEVVRRGETAQGAFPKAERMTTTDPVDTKMTGDFRRY